MKKYLMLAIVLLTTLICSAPSALLAQEEETEDYSWGVVSSISSNRVIIIEYDYNTYEDVNVTYTLDPQVKLLNIESLEDIKPGDNVEIDYAIKDGKKIAKIISIEKPSYEEEYMPSETYE